MSRYTPAQQQEIFAQARACLAGHIPTARSGAAVSRPTGPRLVYKTRIANDDDGAPVRNLWPPSRVFPAEPHIKFRRCSTKGFPRPCPLSFRTARAGSRFGGTRDEFRTKHH
jgi:hypothetical protein